MNVFLYNYITKYNLVLYTILTMSQHGRNYGSIDTINKNYVFVSCLELLMLLLMNTFYKQ